MGTRMMLALVISQVLLAWVPAEYAHILCHLVTYPEEALFHQLRMLSFNSVIGDAHRCGIIAMHRCFGLLVLHGFNSLPAMGAHARPLLN